MATFVIPNVLMALLLLTPFIDRGPERRIQRRPIALFSGIAVIVMLAYLTNLGATSEEGVGAEGLQLSGLESNAEAQAGSELWVQNCTSCHQIAGVGQPGPGPNLSNVGTTGVVGPDTAEEFLKNPPGSMPPFTNFTPEQYTQLGTFLGGLGTEFK
jgi:menaquinol-cytochrome c reductase cytochrome b/c subunit